MHRESLDYRDLVKRKLRAYYAFIQAALIAQGLLQYLAAVFPQLVWHSFGSWLRTIRPGIRPPNSSSQPRCASGCRNFSWITQKTISSGNSSSVDEIRIKSSYSAGPHSGNSGRMSAKSTVYTWDDDQDAY